MLFCIFNWHKTEGLDLVLTGCLLCLAIFSTLTKTRTRKGLKRVGIAMLCCELLCSLVWQIVFSVSFAGLWQGILLCMLYPASLAVSGAVIALYPKINRKNKERL